MVLPLIVAPLFASLILPAEFRIFVERILEAKGQKFAALNLPNSK